MKVWRRLSHGQLKELASAVASGQEHSVLKQWGQRGQEAAAELDTLLHAGMARSHAGYLLEALVAQSHATQKAQEDLEVVWTGPEGPTSQTRDTLVTARQMLEQAEHHVLLASYVFYDVTDLLEPLALRMAEHPGLQVTVVADVSPRHDKYETQPQSPLQAFKTKFLKQWPGTKLPKVYFDPRALEEGSGLKAVMHAKCILVDDRVGLVTSANLTGAAHLRNIEVGLLTHQAEVVSRLRGQFMSLVDQGKLLELNLESKGA